MHIFIAITTSTSVPLIAVEMEDTFNEVLEEHGGIPGQEEVRHPPPYRLLKAERCS